VVSGLVYGVGVTGGTHFVAEGAAIPPGLQMLGLQVAEHALAGGADVPALRTAQPPLAQLANQRVHEILPL